MKFLGKFSHVMMHLIIPPVFEEKIVIAVYQITLNEKQQMK